MADNPYRDGQPSDCKGHDDPDNSGQCIHCGLILDSLEDAVDTHNVIDHAVCYAQGTVHTNGLENFWSLLKRAIKGTYVSVEPFHLFRYLDEQAFKFNHRTLDDSERFALSLAGVMGKRVTYAALTGSELPERC